MMKVPALLTSLFFIPLIGHAKDKEPATVPNVTLSQVQWGTPVNDVPFNKDQLAGKVVVVEEWGVNCPPCIAFLPDLARLAKSNEKKGLVVVGLERQNGSKEAILALIKKARVEYPVLSGGDNAANSSSLPDAAVFGVDGKLVWSGNPHDSEFEKSVKKALKDVKEETTSKL